MLEADRKQHGANQRITEKVDHLVWVAPTLVEGSRHMFERTGVFPAYGGTHASGSHNSLIGLGAGQYLEILSVDPSQSGGATQRWLAGAQGRSGLALFAIASTNLAAFAERARSRGFATSEPTENARTTPDGAILRWRGIFLLGHSFGAAMPFFIEWLSDAHPGRDDASDIRIAEIVAITPEAEQLRVAVAALGIDDTFHIEAGPVNGVKAVLDTPRGRVVLNPIDPPLPDYSDPDARRQTVLERPDFRRT